MDKITAAEQHTFFSGVEFMKINSPAAGLIASDHKDITIVPRIGPKGESMFWRCAWKTVLYRSTPGKKLGLQLCQLMQKQNQRKGNCDYEKVYWRKDDPGKTYEFGRLQQISWVADASG